MTRNRLYLNALSLNSFPFFLFLPTTLIENSSFFSLSSLFKEMPGLVPADEPLLFRQK